MRATFRATRKASLFLFSVAVLLAGGAAAVRGQSALDGFDPNASGEVLATGVQPDGKILIGGVFTTVLGVAGLSRWARSTLGHRFTRSVALCVRAFKTKL
jgi:hypothetical protein